MPLQKTIIWISRVTQPCGALSTKPACVHATVLGLSALSAIASLPLRGATVVIDLHWKVSKRKGADGGGRSTSTSATTTIVTDQFGSQLEPKSLMVILEPLLVWFFIRMKAFVMATSSKK